MKVGILQTDDVRREWAAEFGEYSDMFIALLARLDPALEFIIYDVQRGQYPADIDEVDAYLMTGSKAGVYDNVEWIHRLAAFICKLNTAKKKLVGICFGHQMIAHALGGRAEKSKKGWGVGRHTYTLTRYAAQFGTEGSEFRVLASHQDQVVVPAEGARVLASSVFCPVAMMQVGTHMLSFQGHPEFEPGYARKLLDARRECVGEACYHRAVATIDESVDRDQVAGWMLNFMRG